MGLAVEGGVVKTEFSFLKGLTAACLHVDENESVFGKQMMCQSEGHRFWSVSLSGGLACCPALEWRGEGGS